MIKPFNDLTLRNISELITIKLSNTNIREQLISEGILEKAQEANVTDKIFYGLKQRQEQNKCGNNTVALLVRLLNPKQYTDKEEYKNYRISINENLVNEGIEIDKNGQPRLLHKVIPISEPMSQSVEKERAAETLDKFQLEEYKNISIAHFETNKQIGEFFRYFLIITSTPAVIFVWFGKESTFLLDLFQGKSTTLNTFVGIFLIVISLISYLASFYLISLKLDNILYARTINGVRRFFHRDFEKSDHYRVLPINTNIPKYFDFHTFGIVVIATAIISSTYFSIGTYIIAQVGYDLFKIHLKMCIWFYNYGIGYTILVFVFGCAVPLIYYSIISTYRKDKYLKNSIIGIDIDGVLNNHRKTFCEVYNKNGVQRDGYKHIELLPFEITRIPVRYIDDKDIKIDDEFDVFNDPNYWICQEIVDPKIVPIIKELKNILGYKVYIHSYRPWPAYEYGTIKKDKVKWNKNLKRITIAWLKANEIPYSKLYIEKSSISKSVVNYSLFGLLLGIPKSRIKNRYYRTRQKAYRYFIEDSFENAVNLSMTCDYVFLLDQPYNQSSDSLPRNVFRVRGWDEIRNSIKNLG